MQLGTCCRAVPQAVPGSEPGSGGAERCWWGPEWRLGGRDGDEGIDGPQGLYVIYLAHLFPPPEETKVAGIEQALEGRQLGG